jgi:hypothetical protein
MGWPDDQRVDQVKTLRVRPPMEAGVVDHAWSLEEIAALADQAGRLRSTSQT